MVISLSDMDVQRAWQICEQVMDPEVPVISVTELGIIRSIDIPEKDHVHLVITPTYSGCPAMDMIGMSLRLAFLSNGFKVVDIETVLSPAWTTEWLTETGKQKLKAFGIAPPNPLQPVCDTEFFASQQAVQCPRCNSYHTSLISQFGSTACKALYRCDDCKEPFDYFKCH